MKIFHIITGLNQGGAETFLFRLVSGSGEQCQHIVVSLTGEGYYGPRLRELGVPLHTLDMARGRVSLRGLVELSRLLQSERPDVVQTWMYHADLVGGLAARWSLHCPVVWGIRNSNLDPQKTSRSTRLVVKICALLSRWIPAIIVSCSQQAAQVHRELGYRADRFRVIPNGYDLKRLAPDLASRSRQRQEWGVAEDELLLGMVARWDPQKDHANLFAALSLLAQAGCYVRCVLAGPGMTAETPRLMRLVHRYQLQDRLILNGPSDDVPSVMNALDVLVLSSEYGEAFPNVVAEAMACGTPCVVTDVGDAAYIVSDNGWVVPPADPRALAEAIGQALKAVSSRGKTALGLAARERIAERFSMESVTRRYTELYEGLVS